MSDPSPAPRTLSRRTVARGLAWSVPVVALSNVAPAYAASQQPYYANICRVHYGDGGVNGQTANIFFGWCTQTGAPGTINAGATFTFRLAADQPIPDPAPAVASSWYTRTVTRINANSLEITFRLTRDQQISSADGCYCGGGSSMLVSFGSGSQQLVPGTVLTSTNTTNGDFSGTLEWQVPKRYQGTGSPRRAARFLSSSGYQGCFPETSYSMQYAGSNYATCGDGENSTSTIYPDGTCRFVRGTTGQMIIPKVC